MYLSRARPLLAPQCLPHAPAAPINRASALHPRLQRQQQPSLARTLSAPQRQQQPSIARTASAPSAPTTTRQRLQVIRAFSADQPEPPLASHSRLSADQPEHPLASHLRFTRQQLSIMLTGQGGALRPRRVIRSAGSQEVSYPTKVHRGAADRPVPSLSLQDLTAAIYDQGR